MVVRIAGLGYQRGFGGHFHNDNSLAVLRDIPGLVIACPSNGADAARMLRECIRLAREEQRIVVFVEPIALYTMRDLHDAGDDGWLTHYPTTDQRIGLDDIGQYGDGKELAIISYANGYYLSRQAEKTLSGDHGIKARVIDMRWIAPIPVEALLAAVKGCKKVLVVDECRHTASQSEGLMTMLMENGHREIARVTAEDCFIATGPAYASTLPSKDGIVAAALELAGGCK